MRGFTWTVALCAACGGTAVIDGGGSEGGSAGSGQGGNGTGNAGGSGLGSSTGGNTSCEVLGSRLDQALASARACDSCDDGPDPCEYFSGQELGDRCGCPMPVNSGTGDAVSAALMAYGSWKGAGCGPIPCDAPCAVSNNPSCESTNGQCPGQCEP